MSVRVRSQSRSSVDRPPASAAWTKHQRNTSGAFNPPHFQGRLSHDAVLEESRRQIECCHRQLQDDLDLLHEQVHAEIHSAVAQELQGVAHSIGRVRRETMDELQRTLANDVKPLTDELRRVLEEDIAPLRLKVGELSSRFDEEIYSTATPRPGEGTGKDSQDQEKMESIVHQAVEDIVRRTILDNVLPLQEEVHNLREELYTVQGNRGQAAQEIAQVLQAVEKKAQEVASVVAQAEVQGALGAAREATVEALREQTRNLKLDNESEIDRLDASIAEKRQSLKAELLEEIAGLRKQMESQFEESTGEIQVECSERLRIAQIVETGQRELTEVRSDAQRLLEQLEQLARVGDVRFTDAQAAFADMEQRITDGLMGRIQAVAADVTVLARHSAEQRNSNFGVLQMQLKSLLNACQADLSKVRNSWARVIEWTAELDVDRLREDGRAQLSSSTFTAACLQGLQLRLRLTESSKGWACGVFLAAPAGQVSFRLHFAGKSQTFERVDFGNKRQTDIEKREWGSPRITVLDHITDPKMQVRLEILDVFVSLSEMATEPEPNEAVANSNTGVPSNLGEDLDAAGDTKLWPTGLSGYARIADEAHVASREAAAIRASLVRRVEWRVTRISERLDAARRAFSGNAPLDDEALEPLVSPPFSAAGLEGLQMHLYPIGYRPRGDDMCGLFLTCPRGVFVRCRIFVADAVRTFEYNYETREPYGRQNMCRLSDKVGAGGAVVCGVEFLEVRQESTTQIRGGPFGHTTDQVKVVLNPGGGGMASVRELDDLRAGSPRDQRRAKGTTVGSHAASGGNDRVPRQMDAGTGGTKSLPLLKASSTAIAGISNAPNANLPTGSSTAAIGSRTLDIGRTRRQLDM